MPQPGTGVYLRNGSNVYQWGIRTPSDLQHLYTSETWAHRCSLRTTDLREANVKAAKKRAEWLETFERQRRAKQAQQGNAVAVVTPAIAGDIAALIAHNVLSDDEKLRNDASARAGLQRWMELSGLTTPDAATDPLAGMSDAMADKLAELHARHDAELKLALARGKLTKAIPAVQRAALALGLEVNQQTPGIELALSAGLTAMREASAAQVRRDAGDLVVTPSKTAARRQKAYHLRDVFNQWNESVGVTRSRSTVRNYELALAEYEKFAGDTPIAEITRAQGEQFKAHLHKLTLASKTKRMRLNDVKSLFRYAHNLEWIDRHPWNAIDIDSKTETPRFPWPSTLLQTMFGLPLFQEYALPHLKKAGLHAAYWIPLIGLYTGARLGELCQLFVTDIRDVEGVWMIDINEDEDRSLKTAASVRTIPVHSELVRLGFLDYVRDTRDVGHKLLWPKLPTPIEDKPSHCFSWWFCNYPRNFADPTKKHDFVSFRHSVRTKLMEANQPEKVQDRITGHETTGNAGKRVYAQVGLALLVQAVESITYPTLQLPRVYSTERAAAAAQEIARIQCIPSVKARNEANPKGRIFAGQQKRSKSEDS